MEEMFAGSVAGRLAGTRSRDLMPARRPPGRPRSASHGTYQSQSRSQSKTGQMPQPCVSTRPNACAARHTAERNKAPHVAGRRRRECDVSANQPLLTCKVRFETPQQSNPASLRSRRSGRQAGPSPAPAHQYRRARRAEPAAPRRRLDRPRRRIGTSRACQRRRSICRAALLAVVTTPANTIVIAKKAATKATLVNPFTAQRSPQSPPRRPESLMLPVEPWPHRHWEGLGCPAAVVYYDFLKL